MSINKKTVGMELRATLKEIGRHIHMAFADSGDSLTIEQFILLDALNNGDNLTQQDLSIMLKKDKSGILRQTDELEKKKLVVRMADDDDRRKKILMLTKKGVETIQRMKDIESNVFDRFLEGISEDKLTVLSDALKSIRSAASR